VFHLLLNFFKHTVRHGILLKQKSAPWSATGWRVSIIPIHQKKNPTTPPAEVDYPRFEIIRNFIYFCSVLNNGFF
jgi:hypothetical protein